MLTSCGARVMADGVSFAVWAPDAKGVEVVIYAAEDCEHSTVHTLSMGDDGVFRTQVSEAREGSLYKYRVEGKGPFPDPVSRFQPKGVHGPSQVIDLGTFKWTDSTWRGVESIDKLVVYELHVGTFSDKGTYKGVQEKLRYLKDLGITALQLMPLADFPGNRNWGYDGVCLYAPARCYGTPDELCQLIDAAHAEGLAVFLDCVYNHLGPDGNYLGCFSTHYFTEKTKTPWGPAVNVDRLIDAKHAPHVRKYFMENALCWLKDYHIDGLRLDATHAILDTSKPHFLQELARACHESSPPGKRVYMLAEDDRNDVALISETGLDGLWADDMHHQVRVRLTGEQDGYYADFTGTTEDIARTVKQGWYFTGQAKKNGEKRGTDPNAVANLARFSFCIQNHDQIGNRAMGDRLNHAIDSTRYAAASALLLLCPQSPLLFMGQEWGASSPFAFFTDHNTDLGKLVTEGRRKEFAHFAAFRDEAQRAKIPDPQSESTFGNSKLKWEEAPQPDHLAMLHLYRTLLHHRATHPACASSDRRYTDCIALGSHTLALVRCSPDAAYRLLLVVNLGDAPTRVAMSSIHSQLLPVSRADAKAMYNTPLAQLDASGDAVSFTGAGALLLRL